MLRAMLYKKSPKIGGTEVLRKIYNTIKLYTIIGIAALLTATPVFAQEITAIDFNGDLIGKVIPDGSVVSFDNEIIGNVTADSFIVNQSGEIIGGIIPQGVVIGNDNKLMGRVNNDGSVRMPSGKIIGKVLPNALVVNDTYDILGAVLFPGLIYNDEGRTVGRLAGDGSYMSIEGQNIGFVSAQGFAYRHNGVNYTLDGKLLSSKMVISPSADFIGSVVPGGKVTNFDAEEIGMVHANGYVYSVENQIVGKVVNTSYAFDNMGKYLGLVSYNGEVLNKGIVVGRMRFDDKIINIKNEVIGFALDVAATASDLNGKYLGRLVPEGKIVKGREVVGKVGPRGNVFNTDGQLIGRMISSGPIFDYAGNLAGQALRNATVSSLVGTPIGYVKGNVAYDNIGRILGGKIDNVVVLDINNNILGMSGIAATIRSGSGVYKISPFGYVYSADNILTGHALNLGALYLETGEIAGYLMPEGKLEGLPQEKQLKLTQFGMLVDPENMVEAFYIDPYFVLNSKGEFLGTFSENNRIIDQDQKVVGKIVPEYKVVSDQKNAQMPLTGSVGKSVLAVGFNGSFIGYTEYNGAIKDFSGKIIGKAINGEDVVNAQNSIIGRIMPERGIVNNECSYIGVLGPRGKVRNNRDVILGSILTNGQVISEVGTSVGYGVQPGVVIDFEGKQVGTVNALGHVLNYDGEGLGCIHWDGKLYDPNLKLIGRKVDENPVMGFNNKIVGRLLANGQVIDAGSKVIGRPIPDDGVLNDYGNPFAIVFRYRYAFDNDNIFMGRVDENANVISDKNDIIAKVNYDGSVTDGRNVVGYALYDFYVYNENNQAIGYILADGNTSSFTGARLGKIDKGFLIDKSNNMIGRGNRDYVVRNDKSEALGELMFNGELMSAEGVNLGTLGNNGEILNADGELVAKALPLQYYNIRRPETPKPADWANKPISIEPIPTPQVEEETSNEFTLKAIGIALSPDGSYLGDILANNDVVDKEGNLIGIKTPDGLIMDNEGTLIGIEEFKKGPTGQMFVPAGTFGDGSAYGIGNQPTNLGPGGGFGPGERYDPVRSAALAAAQSARRSEMAVGQISSKITREDFDGRQDNWDGAQFKLSSWRVDMSEMILADKPIPAVLARTIMSTSVGTVPATAIVERNVYAEDGRNIVIPAGSRILGESSNSFAAGSGSTRVSISWKRLIRPDGSAFEFSSAQTGDAQGRAGALGYVDQQLLKKYVLPLATSTMPSVLAYFTATAETTGSSGSSDSVESSRQQAANDARQNFLSQMDQIFQEILADKTKIEAVAYVPIGTRMIIYPKEDLWIRTVERSQKDREEKKQYEDVLISPDRETGGGGNNARSGGSASSGGSTSGVVYEDEDVDVEPSKPLIASTPKKKKGSVNAIPPVTTTGATPPPPSTTSGSASSSGDTPQLF